MQYAYPCNLKQEPHENGFLITFPDLPGVLTDGGSAGEVLENAQETLELTLEHFLERREEPPAPSELQVGQELIVPRAALAAQLALMNAMRRIDASPENLAEHIGITPGEAHALVAPRGRQSMAQLERALRACGRRLVLEDIPDDSGRHLTESAVGGSGTLGMTRGEFIRRIRRYALAHELQWRLEPMPGRPGLTQLDFDGRTIPLTDPEDLRDEWVRPALDYLGVTAREF